MGLDQYAHLRGHKVDWEKYYSDTEASIYEQKQVFVWRKHARLQEFMAQKWTEQNPSVKVEGMLAHLGFNSDQDAPCYMTKEVVDELGKQIEKGFSDYVAEDGFFWGQQFQEESVKEYKDQDIKFLKYCQQAISDNKVVEYWCSW
jgi:recombinational DNA repair protein RecT